MRLESGLDKYFFFNDHLTGKLNRIIRVPLTIVRSRAGSGKTTAVNSYLSGIAARTIWHFCGEDFPVFHRQFRAYLRHVYPHMPEAGELPAGEASPEQAAVDCAIRMKEEPLRTRVVYVLETRAEQVPEQVMTFLTTLCLQQVEGFHAVIISRAGKDAPFQLPDHHINLISDEDFLLNAEEITHVCEKNGVRLIPEEADFLLLHTEGLISSVLEDCGVILKKGKSVLYPKILQALRERPEMREGISPPSAGETPGAEESRALQTRLHRALERFDLEEAEIIAGELALRPEAGNIGALDQGMLRMLKGEAPRAFSEMKERSERAREEGRPGAAAELLETALQIRVFLGDRFWEEARELIGCYEEGWLNRGGSEGIIGCFSLLRQSDYRKIKAYLLSTPLSGEGEDPLEREMEQCRRDLLMTAACQHTGRPEEARPCFERARETILRRGYYLASFLLYEEISRYIGRLRQQDAEGEEKYLRPFLSWEETLSSARMPHPETMYWTEIEEFREKWTRFRQNMKKNFGDDYLDSMHSLTAREREIIQYVRNGQTNREIARTLYISENTVKTTLKKIFRKLGIESRKELV